MNMKKIYILFSIAIFSLNTQAGIMANLNEMFMSNTTAPTTISTKDRAGVFGGSFMMRAPIQNVNIVSFDPPRLDAGCGGVDLYLGSFSFINGQQIVALFRQVAANAVGLAFKAALDAISPSLSKLISEFHTLLQNMNNLAKNTCSLAHLLTDDIDKELSSAVSGDAATLNVQMGKAADWIGQLNKYVTKANDTINQSAHLNPKAGNGVAKTVVSSGTASILGTVGLSNIDGSADDATNPNSLNNRVLISLLGFKINAVSCSITHDGQTQTSKASPGNGMTQVSCGGQNTITLDSIIKGGGTNSANPNYPLMLWYCNDPTGSSYGSDDVDNQICTKMETKPFTYQGIKGYVNNMLFGVGDLSSGGVANGSIMSAFTSGSSIKLNSDQVQFIKQSGVPLIGLLSKSTDPSTRVAIASQLEPHITACISAKVGEALYKAANGVKDVSNYQIPEDSIVNIRLLKEDYMTQQNICNERKAVANVISQLVNATILSTTKAK